MKTHTTVNGHQIDFEPTREVAAFLSRLGDMVGDPKVGPGELLALAYSEENPILERGMFAGRGHVTKAIAEDPAYLVMSDLIYRKRLAASKTKVEDLAARYTMTVADAARTLGVHESAIKQAIAARRLASWLKGGRHYLEPEAVAKFQISGRGPKPEGSGEELSVRFGHTEGFSFRVRSAHPISKQSRVEKNVLEGTIQRWKRVLVFVGGGGFGHRLFVLDPADKPAQIVHGPFFIRGHFEITEKVNNPGEAERIWKNQVYDVA